MNTFAAVAEPHRRLILDRLRDGECAAGDLVELLALSQPSVSKHLRVLREAGLVSTRIEAQRRIYALDARPLVALDSWLDPYRRTWERSLDALERHLDRESPSTKEQ